MTYCITPESILEYGLSGFDLINFPLLNNGTAFLSVNEPISPCMGCYRRISVVSETRRLGA